MDWPGVRQVPEDREEQRKAEKTGCGVICLAPTTPAVKGKVKVKVKETMKAGLSAQRVITLCWLIGRLNGCIEWASDCETASKRVSKGIFFGATYWQQQTTLTVKGRGKNSHQSHSVSSQFQAIDRDVNSPDTILCGWLGSKATLN